MNRLSASESQQQWDLTGRCITQLVFDPGAVRLATWHLEGEAEIRLGVPFHLRQPDGSEYVLDPEQTATLSPVFGLLQEPLRNLTAFRSGGLHVAFENGTTIVIEPHPAYEAWEASGSGDLMGVAYLCGPDGGSPWGQ
jgi:hypothetical protein